MEWFWVFLFFFCFPRLGRAVLVGLGMGLLGGLLGGGRSRRSRRMGKDNVVGIR